ncbi:unnamed protein product [Rotaria magnacalcarata]|uniref:B box-type domain-containing protein n=1 Tax=Rotaria magnacalcarata TaxID=392030 RepID=A0A816PNE9_9BILA|nr:unnamed protein product [Rotaria magnacalcarata]CAF1630940.1 unnamed protein product [Rotaria magnacalcarata]CAF1914581.1 unnamed protein product [Rotaria magnacalcarata]CAF2050603.1 unnamed protein product [Rotaria magnacalcarata]CAF2076588.1 unnamed protein product [Rotaria magnacalcarata]
MTTSSTKKTCIKCTTNTDLIICDGCQKNFCQQHISEHRNEVMQRMNQIDNECERFRQNLPEDNDPTPLLSAIEAWEEESIEKIHLIAASARADVQKYTKQTLDDLNEALNKITLSMKSNREKRDAVEVNLKNWNHQLQTLQDLLKLPFPIGLISDPSSSSSIQSIKVTYEPPVTSSVYTKMNARTNSAVQLESRSFLVIESPSAAEERFHRFAGHVRLSENSSVATCVGYSSVCGAKVYLSGVHRIRFRIIAKKNDGIFFGILTSSQEITARATELPSVYGWRDFDRAIMNSTSLSKTYKEKSIQANDRLTLTINCDNAQLVLTHHRLKHKLELSVNLDHCPLPWKLLVSSYGEDKIGIIN